MNTNILEVATLAAIVAITWFLVSVNSDEIGSTNITNDVLNEVAAENSDSNKKSYTLKAGNDKAEVELTAKCNGCDKKDKFDYLWTHKGSFEKREYSEEGISFRRPVTTVLEFSYDEDSEIMGGYKTKEDYVADANANVEMAYEQAQMDYKTSAYFDVSMTSAVDYKDDVDDLKDLNGAWDEKEKADEWDYIDAVPTMEDNTSDKMKVQLGVGYHAFTCQISDKDGKVLNLNDDEELDLVWVLVEDAPEKEADFGFVLNSNEYKAKPKTNNKSKAKKTEDTKVDPAENSVDPAADPAGN
tara:strand:- start:142 stop:1038 length:897 start_codon:yes stop_codon:yes gene_type:complete